MVVACIVILLHLQSILVLLSKETINNFKIATSHIIHGKVIKGAVILEVTVRGCVTDCWSKIAYSLFSSITKKHHP